jgi:hypothetical protein
MVALSFDSLSNSDKFGGRRLLESTFKLRGASRAPEFGSFESESQASTHAR